METTMTDTDKVIQVAASRIQGLTRLVNHWKERTNELEAALGSEKAARISAEATRDRALNAGAANVELQEELRRERAEHQETCRYLADAQTRVRALLSESDGLFARLRQSIAHGDFAGIALAEAHGAIWGLGCEMTNLRCDFATARDERDRALGKWVDEKVSQVFDCTTDFLRAEIADLRRTFDAVHYALGIKSGDNIIEAIDKLKQERDCAKDEWDREEERCKGLASDIEVLRVELRESQKRLQAELAVIKDDRDELRAKLEASEAESRGYYEELRKRNKPKAEQESENDTAQGGDIKVGDYVEVFQATHANWTRDDEVGIKSTVRRFDMTSRMIPVVWLSNGGGYALRDVRKIQREPKPGDKVRLVRVPTEMDCEEYDYTDPEQRRLMERRLHTTGTVLAGKHECGCLQVQMAHSAFVKAWPQSCIEIVDGK